MKYKHSGKQPFFCCTLCPKHTQNMASQCTHIRWGHLNLSFTCLFCDYSIFLLDYWHNHVVKAHSGKVMFLDPIESTVVATMLAKEIKKELA